MSASCLIRPASVDDVAHIQRIARETWPSAYGEILSAAQITYMLDLMYSTKTLSAQMAAANPQHFLLLRDANARDDDWCGFAAFQLDGAAPSVSKLHKLYCLPRVQGRGFGRALVDEVKRLCLLARQRSLILNVNKYNRARHFYEGLGFRVLREEVVDIGEGYVMDDFVLGSTLTSRDV